MTPLSKQNRLIIIIVIILVVLFLYINGKNKTSKDLLLSAQTSTPLPPSKVESLKSNQFPLDFPHELKIEERANIIRSYQVENESSIQTTVVLESKRNVASNFLAYKTALEKNVWQIDSAFDNQEGVKSIHARRSGVNLSITIIKGADPSVSTLEVTYLKSK